MNELTYIDKPTFLNKELNKSTNKIRACGENIRKNYLKIAHELATIEEGELYLEDGFENVIDYAKKTFGMGKSTAYNLLSIGRHWVNDKGDRTLLTDDGIDYSISQIGVLLSVGYDTAKDWHDKNKINPLMSVRTLKDIVKEDEISETPEDDTEDDNIVDGDADISECILDINIFSDGAFTIKGDAPEGFSEELEKLINKYIGD